MQIGDGQDQELIMPKNSEADSTITIQIYNLQKI